MNTNTGRFSKVANFARKHWFFILMLISGITLLFIHTIYKICAPLDFFESEWEAGDALSFAGSIIGAVATIYVLQETIRFTVLSQKEEHTASIRPYFVMDAKLSEPQVLGEIQDEHEIKLNKLSSNTVSEGPLSLILHLQNVGAGNAIVEQIAFSRIEPDINKSVCNVLPALLVGEKYYIRIACKPETLQFRMIYTDVEKLGIYCAETKIHLTVNAGRSYLSVDPLTIQEISKKTHYS